MFKPLPSEKRFEWAEKIRQQKESDLSVSRWCRERQISYSAFLYWKDRLSPKPPIHRASFTELPEVPATAGITIECQKIQIHLTRDFDPILLTKCLRALKEATC